MLRVAVLAIVALAGAARADDRPAAIVIGVVAKDAPSAAPADAITATIRTRAAAKASDYRVVATPKQIETALHDADCDRAQPRCEAEVGKALGADVVLAGELERRGTHQTLVLSLVDVETKQRTRSVRQTGAAAADAKKLARSAYDRLVGDELGQLSIVANAQQGEVLIDGQVVAGLFEGKTTIGGLVRGNHLLSIRARGFRPLDVDVTVETTTKQTLLLDPE